MPAVVRQLADREQLELALVENLQREDLDPLETARRLPPADRRVRVHPGRGRRAGRARPLDGRQHAPPARPRARRPGGGRGRPAHRGPRSRARRTARRAAGPRRSTRSSGRSSRVRQTEELVRRLREPKPDRPAAPARRPRSRPRAGRGGPPPAPRHQGQPRPIAARRPDRHRVLQRRGARPALRASDRRNRVTEEATTQPVAPPPAGRPKRTQGAERRRLGLHGREHPGPRGPRGRPQAPGHVHRLDRRARPASPDLGGRRQLDRRGDGRPGDDDQRHDPRRRQGHRPGRRPRRAGRQAFDRQGRARGRPHGPPRRRQVRRRRLQGVGRPARRRRQRRQRAVEVDARRIGPRRLRLGPGVRARQADRAGQEDRAAGHPAWHHAPASWPTPTCSRRPSTRSR